jgi:hypothetical protein
MSNPQRPWVRAGRSLWGGLGLILLVLLGLSFFVSPPGLENAETSARQRAERIVADVLLGELPPRLASDDIVGTVRRDLLEVVQGRILTDDRIARVLIWRPDGDLIFSTGPRDGISQIDAEDHLQFGQAANGVPASVVIEATATRESLHQTFVPLRVPSEIAPYAVAQIDQRYRAIQDEANRVWRPLQFGLVAALGVAVVLFALSFVLGRTPRPAGEPGSTSDEPPVRDADDRARAAERHPEEPPTAPVPAEIVARIEDLEMNLRGEVAEREQAAARVQQLQASLEAKEAELALATERAAEPETEDSAELVAEADRRAADAAERIAAHEARVSELETALRRAEERAARDLDTAQLETTTLTQQLAEIEASLAEARTNLADRERIAPGSGAAVLEVELLRAERDVATADLRRAEHELETMRGELDAARASIAELEARPRDEIA